MPKRRHGLAFVRLSQSLVLALLVAGPHAAGARAAQKLKPEEVVARHLEAVGPAGARAAKCSRMIVGASRASFRGGVAGSADGIAVIASEGEKFLIGMRFALPEYPHEKVGYDGRDLTVSYLTQGTRSALGGFLLQHEAVFRRGLMGGALSCSWPLWGATDGGVKLIYSGEKKVGGRELHVVRYEPRRGADLRVSLFFDAESFRHVRTQYERVITANIGAGVDNSSSQSETRYRMVEEFSEFGSEGGLTLPHAYKLQFSIEATNRSAVYEWEMRLRQFNFDQVMSPRDFKADS
jgi:hypothetical protein